MVFDNADDPVVNVQDFFPSGKHGRILITTRIPDMVLLARGTNSDCSVSSMNPEEALELLLKAARRQGELMADTERGAAVQLLEVSLVHYSL
jgi:hypothetical protein